MNWHLLRTQIAAIARLELKRHLLGRRWVGLYVLALAPIFLTVVGVLSLEISLPIEVIGNRYAAMFQFFMLRFVIFFACGTIFSQLFRGEILEKTLHFYLLTPVSRFVIAAGKYVAGVIISSAMFAASTFVTFLLIYYPSPSMGSFFFDGPGFFHLAAYVGVVVLACMTYGALFLVVGLLFRNPGPMLAILLAWESFNFLLTPVFQYFSTVHYLRSLLPVAVDLGPLAVIVEPSPPLVGIACLLIFSAVMLALAGKLFGRTQVTYSSD